MKVPRLANGTSEMPFLDHLEELRWRLLWCILAIIIAAGIGFVVVTHFDVLGILTAPIIPYLNGEKLKYLSPTDPFFITLKLAILLGLILAAPIIVYQIWSFLSPALKPEEKRAIVPSLYLGLVLFAGGVAMAYFIVLPVTLRFTMGFQTESLEQAIVIGEYMSVVTRLLLAFGIVFEMPVVILVLAVLGLVTPQFLAEKRRYALGAITVLAAVITPGDVITITILMMVPLMLLYELSIVLARLVTRGRRADAAEAAAGA
ncbi:MAG TPA: twin-arginine translocase subunit TatC [Longimicrobiaceae bacterium]|nr:twin-arginine translocase subunit TatC [Longimicrobiaceae bacterium]